MIKLQCENCGGRINPKTYTCEYCGTKYKWEAADVLTMKMAVERPRAHTISAETMVTTDGLTLLETVTTFGYDGEVKIVMRKVMVIDPSFRF